MNISESHPIRISHPLVWIVILATTLIALHLVDAIAWLFVPLLMAFLFFYICSPAVDWLKRKGFTHSQAIYSFLGAATIAALIMLALVLPWLITQTFLLQERVPMLIHTADDLLDNAMTQAETNYPWFSEANVRGKLEAKLGAALAHFLQVILPEMILSILSWLPSLLLVPYLAFFFLRDGSSFFKLIMRGVPNAFFERVLLLFYRVDLQLKNYLLGFLALTLLNTITLGLGLWALGGIFGFLNFGQAMSLGLLCAIFAWVPYVGTAAGAVTVVLVVFTLAPGHFLAAGIAILLFIIARTIEDFIYIPLTVGQSMSIHPLLSVMVIFIGGYIGGIAGLILAMPLLGTIMVFGEIVEETLRDDRLRVRYAYARRLRSQLAWKDLSAQTPVNGS